MGDFPPNLGDLLKQATVLKRLGGLKKHPGFFDLVDATLFLNEDVSVAERIWHVLHKSNNIPSCEMCENKTTWRWSIRSYNKFCSSKCAHSNIEVLNRTKQTNLVRYGNEVPSKTSLVKEKVATTNKHRYGHENAYWAKGRDHNIQQLIQSKNTNIHKAEEITQYIDSGLTQAQIGREIGICQPRVSNLLSLLHLQTNSTSPTSVPQQEIHEFLLTICSHDIILNDTSTIAPHHIDILIPELKLGIELNGVYWHGESKGRHRMYHLHKTRACQKKGVRLIQIYDTEWNNKQQIVKSRLSNMCTTTTNHVHARNTKIVKLTTKQSSNFLIDNHIQGYAPASISYGLINDNGDIVCCMTFCNSRFNKNVEFEMLRFCSQQNLRVVGGASKLLAHAIKSHNMKSVISYADTRWSTGNLYKQLNFVEQKASPPNFKYFNKRGDTSILLSRQQFQKHKLPQILTNFDGELTAHQNMVNHGYDRIWDCGNSTWILRIQ